MLFNKPKANKKTIAVISAAVAVVIAAVAVFCMFFCGVDHSSPESITRDFLTANYEMDADDYVDCLADFSVSALLKIHNLKDTDALEDFVEKSITEDNSELKKYEIMSCKLNNSYDKDEIHTIIGDFALSDIQKESIEDVAAVDVTVKLEGQTKNFIFYCVLMEKDWFVITFK